MNESTRDELLDGVTPERRQRIDRFHGEATAASIREAVAAWEREADAYPGDWKHREPSDVAEWLTEYARRKESGEPINMPLRPAEVVRLENVRLLHTPFPSDDGDRVAQRCAACIAGYDPRTGELVHAAYPCPTVRVIDGEVG